jgi:Flp pilus assembly pilin Flp
MEYTLLLGFVALAAAAIFPIVTDSIKTIWNVASNHLSNAAKAAA